MCLGESPKGYRVSLFHWAVFPSKCDYHSNSKALLEDWLPENRFHWCDSPGVTRLPTPQSCGRWNLRPNLNFTKLNYVQWDKSLTFSNSSFLIKQPNSISLRGLRQGSNELHVINQKMHRFHSETECHEHTYLQVTSTGGGDTMLWAVIQSVKC